MITVRLLGSVDIRDAGGSELDTLLRQPKRVALFSYLAAAVPRGFHRRDTLMGLFWPESPQDQARNALSQALHVLRTELGEAAILTRGEGEVALNEDVLSVDVWALDAAVAAGDPESIVSLYRGPLLNGLSVKASAEFDHWLDSARDRLARVRTNALRRLAEGASERGERHEAVVWWRRLVECDPYSTHVTMSLMQALEAAGDRAGALEQAERHAELLRSDLAAEPSPDVVAFAERLRKEPVGREGERREDRDHSPNSVQATVSPTLNGIRSALADRYAIEREIGSGGMATVYLAEDLKHHRRVAVKVLRTEIAAALGSARFLQEIEIAAQLHHPHILPLYDSGDADGYLYYVMPYEEGQSLREKLARDGELPIDEVVRILRDLADALTDAHKHGVVHRDIKPDNVLLSDRHAFVTDFGVAKAVTEATGRQKLTTEGVSLGTPAYMAPEQAAADPHIDHRADIYAVGAVAYELLTGRPPFLASSPQEMLAAHVTETVEPVTKYRKSTPPILERLVMRCLKKKPADRWQTTDEMLRQLEALAPLSGVATPSDTQPMAGSSRRRWFAPAVMAAIVAVIGIGMVASRVISSRPITISTSNIRAVTSEPGVEWQPALSPDGSEVAFVAHRGGRQSLVIRSTLITAGGGELSPSEHLQSSRDQAPMWSWDGELVRYQSCAGLRCTWKMVPRLGGPVRSVDLPGNAASCAWSPDGSRVAFIALPDSVLSYSVPDHTTTLLVVPEVTRNLCTPAWSPDGSWIAFVDGYCPAGTQGFYEEVSSIWIVGVDGGEPARVTSDDHENVSPVWLDDDHLLFVSTRDGPREVFVVEVGAGRLRDEPRKVPGVTDPLSISYSVDGKKLVYAKSTARLNIWSYPLRSGSVSIADGHPVTSYNAVIENHDISRDGKWIVYDSHLRGNLDIYSRPLDGGSPTPLTDSPLDEFAPVWSPDGSEVAFVRAVGAAAYEVMVVAADGGTPVQLASGNRMYGRPHWSPSGLDLGFAQLTDRLGAWIVSRDTVGGPWGEATRVTDLHGEPNDWAPDGSGVLLQAGDELVLASPDGEDLWRYDLSTAGLQLFRRPEYSWDGSTIYAFGQNQDGETGIWAILPQRGELNLAVAFDDDEIAGMAWYSVGPEHIYVTVAEHESDIWVADVEVER